MPNLKEHASGAPNQAIRQHALPPARRSQVVPRENTAEVVIWNIGVILAVALGLALAVNMALLALHIQ